MDWSLSLCFSTAWLPKSGLKINVDSQYISAIAQIFPFFFPCSQGLPRGGVMERADSFKQMSAIVVLNSVELLGDLMHFPGKLTLSSGEALFLTHLY